MKKILIAGVALLSLSACQDKIAFIDNAKLLDNYQEKKDIKAKLDKQAESMIALREKLVFFMKANNLKRLVIDDLVIDLEEDEVE